ncbi:hypothetical protein BpHYR1_035290, partial [Brachionus plicatilis]
LFSCTLYRRLPLSISDQISQASTVVSLTDKNRFINSTTFQANVFGASFLHEFDNEGLSFRIDRFETAPNFTFN